MVASRLPPNIPTHLPTERAIAPSAARTTPKVGIGIYEEGIECTPEFTTKLLTGCFASLMSFVVVVSLGIIAGGMFLSARNMDKLTKLGTTVNMQFL